MARFEISTEYLTQTLVDLLNTPSPTGDTEYAISFVQGELESMGIPTERTTKGALIANIEGLRGDKPRAVTAHIDTLGAMVKEIKPNGRLKLTALGGLMWPTVDGEGVNVATRSGRQVRGSIVFQNGAAHVNKNAGSDPRTADNLEVRLDERTDRPEETRLLGVSVGDYVYIDPRPEVSDAGFIRSRFLDDKASVACVLAAIKAMVDNGVTAAQSTTVLISNFEEVGHGGMDSLPDNLREYIVVDMACVGDGQNGDEFHCSICLKDSSGPYSKSLSEKLAGIANLRGIDLRPDIYPYYGSDGSAYWRSGGRAEVALIGPGVDNSHAYERTHIDALVDTAQLLVEYFIEE